MDSSSGDQLAYCGSRCAASDGAQQLVGETKCSLPGCNGNTMIHDATGDDLGYCCAVHREKAEDRSLVRAIFSIGGDVIR